jgi:hypothetical protein
VQQVVALPPWGHNVRLIEDLKDPVQREWYAREAIQNGWSRRLATGIVGIADGGHCCRPEPAADSGHGPGTADRRRRFDSTRVECLGAAIARSGQPTPARSFACSTGITRC